MFYFILAYVMPVLKHHYVILYVFICSIFHAPYSVALFLCVMSLKEVLCFLNYIFGIAISPLKISAMVHTAFTVIYGPMNTASMYSQR